jgi:hypothetical protein
MYIASSFSLSLAFKSRFNLSGCGGYCPTLFVKISTFVGQNVGQTVGYGIGIASGFVLQLPITSSIQCGSSPE